MYFEEIYDQVKPFWKASFSLIGVEKSQTYINSIKDNYNQIDNILYEKSSTWWEFALAFTIYQALTAYAISRWEKDGVKEIYFSEIPITVFEEYFRKNMEPEDEFEGNPEYLNQYKGFKSTAT